MSNSLEDLDEDLHGFSEDGETPKHSRNGEQQVIMRPRESFLMVRKPTKRRLFSITVNHSSKLLCENDVFNVCFRG